MNENIVYGNKNWLKTEDDNWQHLAVDRNGDAFFNGKLIPKIEIVLEKPVEIHNPVKRWEILDIR